MLTLFATPMFHFGNRQLFLLNAVQRKQIGVGEYMGHVLVEGIVAPLLVPLALAALGGFQDRDKKDLAAEVIGYQFGGFPLLAQVTSGMLKGGKFGSSLPALSGFDTVAKGLAGVYELPAALAMDNGEAEKALWAMADLLSFYYQVPASKIVQKTREGWAQAGDLDDDAAFLWLERMLLVAFPDPNIHH